MPSPPPAHFNLETAVATWRQFHARRRAFLAEDLDELECHLRDHTAQLVANGLDEETAFRAAVHALGDLDGGANEYRKVYWRKLKRRGTRTHELRWRQAMLKNYLKITWRAILRHRGYTAITVAGLSVGLAVCFLIFLFVRHELSYDRFHEQAESLYRVAYRDMLSTSGALAPALKNDFPEIAQAVRISLRWGEVLVTHEGESRYEQRFFFADSTFFEVFSYPLLKGDPNTALTRPFTVIITEDMARKYFGDEDPMGKTLNLKGLWDAHEFEITGVARNPPSNTHFKFNFLASYVSRFSSEPGAENIESWWHIGDYTYLRLREDADVAALKEQMPGFIMRYQGTRFQNDALPDLENFYTFQPVTDIHLYSHLERELEPNGEVRYLYIFSAVALLILLIACINYMNLATARSVQRAREVGVRKVVGAHRGQLVGQFLSESVVLVLIAMVLAVPLVKLSLPAFNGLLATEITLDRTGFYHLFLIALGIGTVVGVMAGLYPAAVLSRFQPVHVLKGRVSTSPSNARFRHALVVMQFAASVALIIGTVVIQRQLDYMQQKKLGLNPDQVIVLSTRNELGVNGYPAFKEELLQHAGIRSVTSAGPAPPVVSEHLVEFSVDKPGTAEEPLRANSISVGLDFLETMEIPLVRGRDFLPGDLDQIRADAYTPVLVNEAAVREFGWTDPIGQEFACCRSPTPRVVGVVEDFHYQSLKEDILPLALTPSWWSRFVLVRVRTDDLAGTLDFINDRWEAFAPEYPFEFTFMDDHFAQIYDAEERLAQTFGFFSLLAIVLACLGLFGLASFMAQRRTKEIGIRKVLGATVPGIVWLLSREFVKLVALAFVVAAPIIYVAMQRWLEDYAFRIEISGWTFLLAGLTALGVALLTVSYQSVKAALANPVKSLRYD